MLDVRTTLLTFGLLSLGCGAPPREPVPSPPLTARGSAGAHERGSPPTAPRSGESGVAPVGECSEPTARFLGFDWLPMKAQQAVAVRLHDSDLPTALSTLERASGSPLGQAAVLASIANSLRSELPALREFLRAAQLDPAEALHFTTGSGAGTWAFPVPCALDLAAATARLGLRTSALAGVPGSTIAVGEAPWGLVHFSSGQIWLVRETKLDVLGGWLTALKGPHSEGPNLLAPELRKGTEATVQVVLTLPDEPYHVRIWRARGAELDTGSVIYEVGTPIRRR